VAGLDATLGNDDSSTKRHLLIKLIGKSTVWGIVMGNVSYGVGDLRNGYSDNALSK
jgi:hypothetical protein